MTKRQYSLDVLKVVATIFILCHHYQQYISGVFSTGINYYGGIYNFGWMVELFFLLSGYFMFPYLEKIQKGMNLKQFYLSRITRLLPMVAITAIVYQGLVLVYIKTVETAWFMHSPGIWDTLVACMGMQAGWMFIDEIYVNYPVWYVSVLLLCYVILYLGTVCFYKLKISIKYFYLGMVFFGILLQTQGVQYPFMNEYTSRGYIAFFFGVFLSTYFYEKKTGKAGTVVSFLVCLVLIDLIAFHYGFVERGLNYISIFLLFPALLLLFRNNIVCSIFFSEIWGEIASIAFNAFLWHMPMLVAWMLIFRTMQVEYPLLTREGMWGFVLFMLLVGSVSHFCIEKPLKKGLVKFRV